MRVQWRGRDLGAPPPQKARGRLRRAINLRGNLVTRDSWLLFRLPLLIGYSHRPPARNSAPRLDAHGPPRFVPYTEDDPRCPQPFCDDHFADVL